MQFKISSIINTDDSHIGKFGKLLVVVLALCALNNIFRFGIYFPTMLYYAIMISANLLLILFCIGRNIHFNTRMMLFWLAMWLSIFVNYKEILPQYRVVERTISFGMVMACTGPFLKNTKLDEVRKMLLNLLNLGIFLLVLFSFAGYIFHFLPSDHQGFFLGATHHSMILGAVAGISTLNCLHEALLSRKPLRRNIFLFAFLASFIVALLASSRVSVGSAGCAAVAYFALNFKGQYSSTVKYVLLFVIIGFILLQFTGDITGGIRKKMGDEVSIETLTATRAQRWQNRLNEIKHSPIFGVGAHSIRLEYCEGESISHDGKIEPGNAWLFIFSSMGIFAFLLFCSMLLKPIFYFWKNARPHTDAVLLFSQVVFFAVYINAEAHITASGDFTFLYFWLLIALCFPANRNSFYENKLRLCPGI